MVFPSGVLYNHYMTLLNFSLFLGGTIIVVATLLAAIRTVVLPRAERPMISALVFRITRFFFKILTRKAHSYQQRDRIMSFYAPLSLLLLPIEWVSLILLGYTAMFRAVGVSPWIAAFETSGSSLLTLGFVPVETPLQYILAFSEATIGLGIVALMLAFLPSIYASFSRRETLVALLETRAGSPPSAVEMLSRMNRIGLLDNLSETWDRWEVWFADVEESHTTHAALVFFRSPRPDRSWVTAAGTVMDTAALLLSTVDVPRDPHAAMCIRSGYIALRQIADFFEIEYEGDPQQGDPISIMRYEFDEVCQELESQGIPLKADRDQSWLDFAGWRVNYDTTLLAIAEMVMAPYALWASDRQPCYHMWLKGDQVETYRMAHQKRMTALEISGNGD